MENFNKFAKQINNLTFTDYYYRLMMLALSIFETSVSFEHGKLLTYLIPMRLEQILGSIFFRALMMFVKVFSRYIGSL